MTRAEKSGVRLSAEDASVVKGMAKRGDRHHDIAAWFGVNQGRIAEVLAGDRFPNSEVAPPRVLPPAGPYTSGLSAQNAVAALEEAREAVGLAAKSIDAALKSIRER